jgi:hypothetical protein
MIPSDGSAIFKKSQDDSRETRLRTEQLNIQIEENLCYR